MKKNREKNCIISAQPAKGGRALAVAAGVAAYCALFLILFSALPFRPVRLAGLTTGLVFACVFLIFREKKLAVWIVTGGASLYCVLCVAAGFYAFAGGLVQFVNDVALTSNEHMHWGLGYLVSDFPLSATGDFLFSSVVSVFLAIGTGFLSRRRKVLAAFCVAVLLLWLCLGLFPAWYAAVAAGLALALLFLAERGFPWRSALCYLLCAAVAFGAASSCFLYTGSDGVRAFRSSLQYSAEKTFYGKDALPEGDLLRAANMRSSQNLRLEVTLTPQVRTLYLKGFVGGELKGNRFVPTDKNAYVNNDYQGLLPYVAQGGLPVLQYAEYSALGGLNARYNVKIVNKGANAKYVYMPYSVSAYRKGSPYYDLNVRANVFTPKSYEITVCAGDRSSERLTQAGWVLGDALDQTDEMRRYLALEGAYRAFVYDEYVRIAQTDRERILTSFGGAAATSISTAAQVIRRYFTDNFVYTDGVDAIKSDFLTDFYGGQIEKSNAAYFAAAAVYAFRTYGFAARYAEGYLVNPVGSTENTVTVTGRSSHAWAEVYFDGMGWLPIDVTPTFFVEDDEENPVDPDRPDVPPVDPEQPDVGPEQPEKPDKPDDPNHDHGGPKNESEARLLLALKILIPVLSVVLVAVSGALLLMGRRARIMKNKRRVLEAEGEEFGRAAYAIAVRDWKRLGGFGEETLARYGIAQQEIRRFMQIVEKGVYGAHALSANEKNYVLYFIQRAADAAASGTSKWRAFRCKYLLCIGLK